MEPTVAQKIAELINESFRYAHGGIADTAGFIGATQSGQDVRRTLMECAVELRGDTVSSEILSKVDANLRTAYAMGLIGDATLEKFTKLLEEI